MHPSPRAQRLAREQNDDRLLTTAELAAAYRVTRATAGRWLAEVADRIPNTPDGRPGAIRTPGGKRGAWRIRESIVRGLLDGSITLRDVPDGD